MKKHAYLILAHDNLYVLDKLLSFLDDERNDIFVHLDIKCAGGEKWIKNTKKRYSRVKFIERSSVYWAGFSALKVTLSLLKTAVQTDTYDWYHFISGTDLPIKSQDVIHAFFDADEKKQLYFHINSTPSKVIQTRCRFYYPFIECKYYRKSKPLKVISRLIGYSQQLLGINRLKNNKFYPMYNGWAYFSIPHDFASYILTQEREIVRTFRYTLAADEMWIQSVAIHSEFNERVYGYNGKDDAVDASKHFMDWERGKPYTFTEQDFDLLMDHFAFFARKFDANTDREVIDLVHSKVKNM